MADRISFYWQPGCTSCLRTREFLIERGIEFDSHNVLADLGARSRLEQRGLRTVPVLIRGERFCFAQDLDEVAAFVGVDLQRTRLSVEQLLQRLDELLLAANRLTLVLDPARFESRIGNRDRTPIDLAYHIAMIVVAFLDAAHGGALTYEHYERVPRAGERSIAKVATTIETTRVALQNWGAKRDATRPDGDLQTYFGVRPLWAVLERTTWHVAQHCRQLASLTRNTDDASQVAMLDPKLLDGLPLPQAVWDREIQIA